LTLFFLFKYKILSSIKNALFWKVISVGGNNYFKTLLAPPLTDCVGRSDWW